MKIYIVMDYVDGDCYNGMCPIKEYCDTKETAERFIETNPDRDFEIKEIELLTMESFIIKTVKKD